MISQKETWKQKQNSKINQQTIIKNNRKVKAMGKITPIDTHQFLLSSSHPCHLLSVNKKQKLTLPLVPWKC